MKLPKYRGIKLVAYQLPTRFEIDIESLSVAIKPRNLDGTERVHDSARRERYRTAHEVAVEIWLGVASETPLSEIADEAMAASSRSSLHTSELCHHRCYVGCKKLSRRTERAIPFLEQHGSAAY